jgi:penicillin-binding protein 1A
MKKEKDYLKLYLRIFWGLFLFPIVLVLFLFIMIGSGKMGFMPTFEDLENPENNLASQVISSDGELLGTYFLQNRTFVDFNEVSPNMINALVATEDIRFRRHAGIDARGLARVFVKSILLGQSGSGGGSTITQQLAKNLFPRDTIIYRFGISRKVNLGINKFKEWVTAVKLERNYTKDEILIMYLNTVDFGSQSFGIRTAARTFFNTTPDSLNVDQAATLVGVLKAPTWYSPVRNPERSIVRRNVVLSQMRKYDFLSQAEFDSISRLPLELDFMTQDHNVGPATHFREYLRVTMTAKEPERNNYFSNDRFVEDSIQWQNNPLFGWCNRNFKPDGTPYNLYRDGLKIYTTIHSKHQKYAEEAMNEHLGLDLQKAFREDTKRLRRPPYSNDLTGEQVARSLDFSMRQSERYRSLRIEGVAHDSIVRIFNTPAQMKVFSWKGERDTTLTPMDSIKYYKTFLRAGFMAISPNNGHITAYVGGPDIRYFKYDHVKLGKRQAGSTIKPFLYTLAMQEGYKPCDLVANVQQSFVVNDSVWTPKNSGRSEFDGKMVTLKWGLANSVNNISAWLIKRFNPESVIELMKKMGISSYVIPVPSIFLGTADLSLFEMVAAYNTYANKGVYNTPMFVTRIEDKNGNVLAEFKPQMEEAISEETAYLMVNLLQGVVNEGTGQRLRYRYELKGELGGKTGTTQSHADGWYMGIAPKVVAGVWVGGEDRGIRFESLSLGQGANMALPIYALFMQKIYKDTSLGISLGDKFEKPSRINFNLDCAMEDEEQRRLKYENSGVLEGFE